MRVMRSLGFEQCAADASVMRLVEDGVVSMMAVIHADDIFALRRKTRCDQFGGKLNKYIPITGPSFVSMLVVYLLETRPWAQLRFLNKQSLKT